MSNRPTKQVIVVRTKYPDGKGGLRGLRTGKLIAQSCHASLSFLTRQFDKLSWWDWFFGWLFGTKKVRLTEAAEQWLATSYAKICLQVNSEEELLQIAQKAIENNVEYHIVTDSGKTEFNGIPTKTCLALGPDYSDKIDKITGNLSLY